MSKTLQEVDENYFEKLAAQAGPALVTAIDEDFSLDHIVIFNLKPGLTAGPVPTDAKVVNYDFAQIKREDIDEEVAEGIVQNIKMLMAGLIDGLSLKNVKTIDYLDMAGVEEIDTENSEYLHWDENDMQVLIDHFILLGAQKDPNAKLN